MGGRFRTVGASTDVGGARHHKGVLKNVAAPTRGRARPFVSIKCKGRLRPQSDRYVRYRSAVVDLEFRHRADGQDRAGGLAGG